MTLSPPSFPHKKIQAKILFRTSEETETEFQEASKYFDTTKYISDVKSGDLVIPRYSVLPFYKYVESEVEKLGGRLLNTYQEHRYIANMHWVLELCDLTPRTWRNVGYRTVPDTPYGWVLKGATNSRKFNWNTHMYAKDRQTLKDVYNKLMDDPMIAEQGIVFREYVPLVKLGENINGLNISEEYRFFFVKNKIVASGFYWSNSDINIDVPEEATKFAKMASEKIVDKVSAYVIDVGHTIAGEWIVIEVNDFQMSGLSTIEPNMFYRSLYRIVVDLYGKIEGQVDSPPERAALDDLYNAMNVFYSSDEAKIAALLKVIRPNISHLRILEKAYLKLIGFD